MDIFHLQLLVSFLVGGAITAVLSLVAEKSHTKIAGVIVALPSTIAIGYFFIALAVDCLHTFA